MFYFWEDFIFPTFLVVVFVEIVVKVLHEIVINHICTYQTSLIIIWLIYMLYLIENNFKLQIIMSPNFIQ
jgi:hypothetical protein